MVSKSVMRSRAACLGSLVILASVVVHPQSPPADVIDEPEAYRIYATLLPTLWPVTTARATNIVIQAESVIKSDCLPTGMPTGKPLEDEWQSVVNNFKLENARVRTLLPRFPPMGLPYQLVAAANIRSTFAPPNKPWSGFFARFPDSGGYYAVSAVGLNATKTRAMVYVHYLCGGLCGLGKFYLLEKNDGQWFQPKMRISSCMWES